MPPIRTFGIPVCTQKVHDLTIVAIDLNTSVDVEGMNDINEAWGACSQENTIV